MNDPIEMSNILKKIVSNDIYHAKWLNSLSYLEFTGARKICKNIEGKQMTYEIMSHLQEEIRHAQYLKRLVVKMRPDFQAYNEEHLFNKVALRNYFSDLEKKIIPFFLDSHTSGNETYFWVTKLVEERAVLIYEAYQKVLKDFHIDISLRPILIDEEKHLTYANQHSVLKDNDLLAIEAPLFVKLWESIKREVL